MSIIDKIKQGLSVLGIVDGLKSKRFWSQMGFIFGLGFLLYFLEISPESIFGVIVWCVSVICSTFIVIVYVISQAYVDVRGKKLDETTATPTNGIENTSTPTGLTEEGIA